MQYALLGELQFEMLAYFSGLEGRFASDYSEHPRIEGKPRLQWTGDKLDEWTIRLKFHIGYCDPEAELTKLNKTRAAHQVLPFVLANGDYKGEFVITDLQVTSEQTDAQGKLTSLEATLSLKEFVEPENTKPVRKQAGPAVAKAGVPLPPAVQKVLPAPGALATARNALGQAVGQVRNAAAAFQAVRSVVNTARSLASSNPLQAIEKLGGAIPKLDALAHVSGRIGVDLGPVQAVLKDVGPVISTAGNIATEARQVRAMISNLSPGNVVAGLENLQGGLGRIDTELARTGPTLAKLAARAAVRDVA